MVIQGLIQGLSNYSLNYHQLEEVFAQVPKLRHHDDRGIRNGDGNYVLLVWLKTGTSRSMTPQSRAIFASRKFTTTSSRMSHEGYECYEGDTSPLPHT